MSEVARVLTLGTELTRGEIVDTNGAWLASALTELGFAVVEVDTVDDDAPRIAEALTRHCGGSRVVVVTGGLGPTTDDVTAEAVALARGRPLVRNAGELEHLTRRLEARGRPLTPSNAKQADLPEGARALRNDLGSAPGFAFEFLGAHVYALPGVPGEMRALFARWVAPEIGRLVGVPPACIRLRAFGLPESTLGERLAGVEATHGVQLGYRATSPEVEIKVLASGREAAPKARAAAADITARLGASVVYGEGDASLAEVVGRELAARGLSIGCAESCTGGVLSSLLVATPGASAYFVGSVVCYANSVKRDVLGVPEALIAQAGAVSEAVARAMAEGVRGRLGSDLGLAVTGIAGPSGGSADKPVGLVHLGLANGRATRHRSVELYGTRGQIQRAAAYSALALTREALAELG